MDAFPESAEFSIIDSLYNSYDILLSEGDRIHVYCEKCEDIVAEMEQDVVSDMGELDFYEHIVNQHRKL